MSDVLFCQNCGKENDAQSQVCPGCGVPLANNKAPRSQGQTSQEHDPSDYVTNTGPEFVHMVLGGVVLWAIVVVTPAPVPGTAIGTLLSAVFISAWVAVPYGIHRDGEYMRANTNWDPTDSKLKYMAAIPFLGLIIGAFYLFKRNKVETIPALENTDAFSS